MISIREYLVKKHIDNNTSKGLNFSFKFGFRAKYEGNFDAWQEWKKKFISNCGADIETDGDDEYAYLIVRHDDEDAAMKAWDYIKDNAASTQGSNGAFIQYTDKKHHEVNIEIDFVIKNKL